MKCQVWCDTLCVLAIIVIIFTHNSICNFHCNDPVKELSHECLLYYMKWHTEIPSHKL